MNCPQAPQTAVHDRAVELHTERVLYTVSVVSHGQGRLLRQFVDDLGRLAIHGIDRLVITHNQPESRQVTCPNVCWGHCVELDNLQPKGFAANHNAAFAHCTTKWFAVVNPDIRLQSDVFSQLIAQAAPEDVVLAPALLDPHTGKVAPNRGLLTPWEVLRRRLPGWRPADEPTWLPGAFLLIRADAFRRVGGFDERFFLYAEDFDLCARLRLAGGRLRYVPDVKVVHAAQRSSHVRWRYLRWHLQSLLRLWFSGAFWRYRALLRKEARQSRARAAHRPR